MTGVAEVTREQITAARELLGWTYLRLASRLCAGERTLLRYLRTGKPTRKFDAAAIRVVLEAAGIEFTSANSVGAGVRLREPSR